MLNPPTKTSSQLMDTEPGGEGSQYEGQQVVFDKNTKVNGQLTQSGEQFSSPTAKLKAKGELDQQEKCTDKIRYGESISEHGFGGTTVGHSGKANQDVASNKVAAVGKASDEERK